MEPLRQTNGDKTDGQKDDTEIQGEGGGGLVKRVGVGGGGVRGAVCLLLSSSTLCYPLSVPPPPTPQTPTPPDHELPFERNNVNFVILRVADKSSQTIDLHMYRLVSQTNHCQTQHSGNFSS